MARAPRTGRTAPSRPSSPHSRRSVERLLRELAVGGQEGEGDGEVEVVALLAQVGRREVDDDGSGGSSKPQFLIAACTRSRLSRTAASGRPTIGIWGRPLWTSTSTCTGRASIPQGVAAVARASIAGRKSGRRT